MKALTVQQPWAWAIVQGGKDVENRTQAWSYRGPLAIHAGAHWSHRGGRSGLVWSALERVGWPVGPVSARDDRRPGFDTIRAGGIIGVVDLVDVHRESPTCCESPWAEHNQEPGRVVHLELANPRPLPEPIPCKGRLGLCTPPSDVLVQLHLRDAR